MRTGPTTDADRSQGDALTADAGPGELIRWTLRRQRGLIAFGSTAGIVWMGGFAAAPIMVGSAIDDAIDRAGADRIAMWVAVIVGVLVASTIAGAIRHRCAVTLWVRSGLMSEAHLSRRVLDRRGGVDRAPGELVSLGVGDANKIGAIADLTNRGTGAVVTLIAVAIWLLATSVTLGLLVLLSVPITIVLLMPFLSAYDQRATSERRELAEATAAAADGITGLRTAHGLGGGTQIQTWFRERSQRMHDAALALVRFEARLFASIGIVPWVSLIPVIWVGGGQAIDGTITPGTFVTVLGLAQFLTTPIGTLGEVAQVITAGRASARRITDVTTTPTLLERSGAAAPQPSGSGALAIAGVEIDRVGPLDLDVAADETIGIACASPRDAAAIATLLARHRDPRRGTISVDGTDISSIGPEFLQRHLAVIDTDRPWLLAGSLFDNLRLADPEASIASATAALHGAGADDISQRPDALQRPIGERGLRLSGGQRQRVAIAQALLVPTDVLVLIEPTSALDAATEAVVVERFVAADRPTTVVLSTSPPVLAACDRVAFVVDGRVAASERHDALHRALEPYRLLVTGAV